MPIKVSGQAAAKIIPGAQFKVYSGAPHGLFFTHKDELNRDLAAFAAEGRVLQAAAE